MQNVHRAQLQEVHAFSDGFTVDATRAMHRYVTVVTSRKRQADRRLSAEAGQVLIAAQQAAKPPERVRARLLDLQLTIPDSLQPILTAAPSSARMCNSRSPSFN
jgi:hypothetical protein